jgi:hypothetical protein
MLNLVEVLRPHVTTVDTEPCDQLGPVGMVVECLNELALLRESLVRAVAGGSPG